MPLFPLPPPGRPAWERSTRDGMVHLDPALVRLLPQPVTCQSSAAFVTLVANESYVEGPPAAGTARLHPALLTPTAAL